MLPYLIGIIVDFLLRATLLFCNARFLARFARYAAFCIARFLARCMFSGHSARPLCLLPSLSAVATTSCLPRAPICLLT